MLIYFVSREEVEGAAATSAATVFGQISQILRDGLNDASGCRFFLPQGCFHERHVVLQYAFSNGNQWSYERIVSDDASDDNVTDAV